MPSPHLCFLLGTSPSLALLPQSLGPQQARDPIHTGYVLMTVSDSAPTPKEEEENYKVGSLADGPFSDTMGSASPLEPSQDEKRY